MKNIILSLLIVCICCYQCDRCKYDCGSGSIEFNLPIQVYGIKDTLRIGDTLRVKMEAPDKLTERKLNVDYDFIDYNFLLVSTMVKIDTSPLDVNSNILFDWVPIQGEIEWTGSLYKVTPVYQNNTYYYEALMIPKVKGLYEFAFSSFFGDLTPLAKVDGPCDKNQVQVYPRLVNDTNVNFEFLKYSTEPVYHNWDRERFDDYAGFCFYVQ